MAVVLLAAAAAPPLSAQSSEIYRSTGAHGEVRFSDVAEPGAERVVIEAAAPLDDPLAELDRRIAQALSVADALQASRLERERARSEARARAAEARAAGQPEVVYQERYVASPWLYPPVRHRRSHPGPGDEPPQQPPPAEEPGPDRSRAFPVPD